MTTIVEDVCRTNSALLDLETMWGHSKEFQDFWLTSCIEPGKLRSL